MVPVLTAGCMMSLTSPLKLSVAKLVAGYRILFFDIYFFQTTFSGTYLNLTVVFNYGKTVFSLFIRYFISDNEFI